MSAALTTNVDQRLLRTTKFPPEFNTKVDMKKVNQPVIKKWVSDEIARILENEDDVVTELVFNILESSRFPNIKELQISLTGFLDKDAAPFCTSLWKLCLSAQDNPQGIPKDLLEQKKLELMQERIEEERSFEEAKKRQEAERERERDLTRMRERDRGERGRGRGGRGGRGGFDRRPRDSRSPPPRRRNDGDDFRRSPPPRGGDTYVPGRAGRNDRNDRRPPRRRSPSYGRSPSRSRSPPRRRRRHSSPSPSRSPPRRRRREDSRDRSRSRDRGNRRGGDRRSPPPKRSRRASPSPSRSPARSASSGSRSPPRGGNKNARGSPNDLMTTDSHKDSSHRDAGRLSREATSPEEADPAPTKSGADA